MSDPISVVAASSQARADTASFEAFFERESERLFRALVLMTRDGGEAEELTQEAFCRVWERWAAVGAMESPVGYLYRIALNLQRSRLRAAARAIKRSVRGEDAPDPFDEVAARDQAVRALGVLSTRQRAAAVLTGLLGFTSEEAATILGIRAGTVRTLVTQARTRLADAEVHDA
jgi:RNA polymerase sigma-70 factor (ECF subfamily)